MLQFFPFDIAQHPLKRAMPKYTDLIPKLDACSHHPPPPNSAGQCYCKEMYNNYSLLLQEIKLLPSLILFRTFLQY